MNMHVHACSFGAVRKGSECSEGVGLRAAGGFQLQVAQSHTKRKVDPTPVPARVVPCTTLVARSASGENRQSNGRLNLDAAFRFQG